MLCMEGLIYNSQYWLTWDPIKNTNQDCHTLQSTLVNVTHWLPHHLCTLKSSLNSKHQDISNYKMVSCLWEVNALLHAMHILMCWTQRRKRTINVNPILTRGSTEVHGHIHKGLPVESILSHINTVHSLTSHFFKCHFNITLQFTTTCSKWFLPFIFSTKTL